MKEQKSILKLVEKYNFAVRLFVLIVSVFFIALTYNLVLVKNNLVIGGLSGLAIVVKELTGLSPSIFLYIATAIIIIISFKFLEKKVIYKMLFGSLVFNVMVSITEPLSNFITIDFDSKFMLLLFTSFFYGICYGLIFRSGFIIGGSDTISAIISKYTKLPMGTSSVWTNIFIIFFGFVVFGFTKTVYSIFILLISNKIVDIIILGVKDSKMCYIKTQKSKELLDYLLNRVHIGVAEMAGKGGLFSRKEPVLLVIVPFDQYYGLKHLIKKIDEKAFILTVDCHDVSNGYKKNFLPF